MEKMPEEVNTVKVTRSQHSNENIIKSSEYDNTQVDLTSTFYKRSNTDMEYPDNRCYQG